MLNWNDDITVVTDAEAKMLRVSLDKIQAIAEELEVQQALQNPVISTKEVQARMRAMYEALITRYADLVSLPRCLFKKQVLVVILRRWMGERRIRSLGLIGRVPAVIRQATRSAAANMRLVAPIGAPPRLV